MQKHRLENYTRGWIVGAFSPTLIHTEAVEVAVKTYKAGDYESTHYHKVATEITVVTGGTVKMNDVEYKSGDIIIIEPNEPTDFFAVTDAVNTVIKIPGVLNDKYEV